MADAAEENLDPYIVRPNFAARKRVGGERGARVEGGVTDAVAHDGSFVRSGFAEAKPNGTGNRSVCTILPMADVFLPNCRGLAD